MERNKKTKIMVIVSLCVAVLCLTLGFAAFSNTLTISSSAIVTPDESDFKMVIYGVEDINSFNAYEFAPITSTTVSQPELYRNATGENAIIDNSTLTIKNLDINFVKPGDQVFYYFKVVNEGKYDAYILKDDIEAIYNMSRNKTCIADEGTSEAMVQEVCNNIRFELLADDNNYEYSFDTQYMEDSSEFMKISPGGHMELMFNIHYLGEKVADGDFTVDFDDIKLNFSTVEPSM